MGGIVYQSSDFLAGSLSNSNRFTTAPDCGNKIFWNPKGRLGNMMFGYASLVGIAKRKRKIPVIIADCDHHDRPFAFKQKIDNKLCEFVSAFDIPAEPSPSTCDHVLATRSVALDKKKKKKVKRKKNLHGAKVKTPRTMKKH